MRWAPLATEIETLPVAPITPLGPLTHLGHPTLSTLTHIGQPPMVLSPTYDKPTWTPQSPRTTPMVP